MGKVFNFTWQQQWIRPNGMQASWLIRRLFVLALAVVFIYVIYSELGLQRTQATNERVFVMEKAKSTTVQKHAKKVGMGVMPIEASTQGNVVKANQGEVEHECEFEGLKASEVFSGDFKVPQDDPRLLGYVRKCHLIPPSKLPYDLADPKGDPSAKQGVRKYVSGLLGDKTNGRYIDCGANNGETISNTLLLERDYGWSGFLIEADPVMFKQLVAKNRKAWAINMCAGIHTHPYQIEMYRHKGWELTSRLQAGGYDKNGPNWSPFPVKCLPLYTMMKALNLTDLDYMSMDIEGVELKVLQTLPFDKISIKVFSIETMRNTWTAVRTFMKEKGYSFVKTFRAPLVEDDVFLRTDLLNISSPGLEMSRSMKPVLLGGRRAPKKFVENFNPPRLYWRPTLFSPPTEEEKLETHAFRIPASSQLVEN